MNEIDPKYAATAAACIAFGFWLKSIKWFNNKWIPGVLPIVGAGVNWALFDRDLQSAISGFVVGSATVGGHQAIHQQRKHD